VSTPGVEPSRSSAEPVSIHAANADDRQRVIGRIQHELQLLLLEHAAIQKRIGVIKRTVIGLADVFGPDIIDGKLQDLLSKRSARPARSHPGLTDVCREILKECSQPLTVRKACGIIQEKYPSLLARHRNPTASVLVVLRRLASYGEVEAGSNERGARIWLWVLARQKAEAQERS
jgi:hypothetical protein